MIQSDRKTRPVPCPHCHKGLSAEQLLENVCPACQSPIWADQAKRPKFNKSRLKRDHDKLIEDSVGDELHFSRETKALFIPDGLLDEHGTGTEPPQPRLSQQSVTYNDAAMDPWTAKAVIDETIVEETVIDQTEVDATVVAKVHSTTVKVGGARSEDLGAPQSFLLRYSDGVLTDGRGQTLSEDQARDLNPDAAVALPYSSTDISRSVAGYDLLEQLGAGAMGVVFRGYSLRLRRPVAVKLITPESRASGRAIVRFHNEAVLAARLRHPHIVTVFDSGQEQSLHYFVMALIDGESLGARLEREGPMPWPQAASLIIKVGQALQYAHDQGVIHRDVKPDNVMLDDAGEPLLADFGLAMEPEKSDSERTGVVGTPQYMSPEQANGELANVGPLSDQYSLAATLYHLVTGEAMYTGRSAFEVIHKVIKDEPKGLGQWAQEKALELPGDLEVITMKALEKDASRRYQGCREFTEDLQRLINGEPIHARPVSSGERLQKWIWRNRPALAAVFISLSILLTLTLSFGFATISNIERSSEALRKKDISDALNQAETVESAIRVNMLQGRADQARELVKRLTEAARQDDSKVGSIQIVRTNGTIAYGDDSTQKQVAERLKDHSVLAWIRSQHPGFEPKLQALKSLSLPAIQEASKGQKKRFVDIPPERWLSLLKAKEPTAYVDEMAKDPTLVIVRPIVNSSECMICHSNKAESPKTEAPAAKSKPVYVKGLENVRALLVMKRSQRDLTETIADNRRSAIQVALITMLAFGALFFVFIRLLGLRIQGLRFGVVRS